MEVDNDVEMEVFHTEENFEDNEWRDLELYVQGPTLRESIIALKKDKSEMYCMIFWIVLVFVSIVGIIAYPMSLVLFFEDGSWVYTPQGIKDIELTREQQVSVHSELFQPRYIGLAKVWNKFQKTSGLNPYDSAVDHHVGIRSEFKYNPWNCTNWQSQLAYEYSEYQSLYYDEIYDQRRHRYTTDGVSIPPNPHDEINSDMDLRIRNWLYVPIGNDDRTSAADLKQHKPTEQRAYNLDFTAVESHKNASSQKLEEGITFPLISICLICFS